METSNRETADSDYIERDLEQRSKLDNVTVTCPDEVVPAGDRIWCTARGGGSAAGRVAASAAVARSPGLAISFHPFLVHVRDH